MGLGEHLHADAGNTLAEHADIIDPAGGLEAFASLIAEERVP